MKNFLLAFICLIGAGSLTAQTYLGVRTGIQKNSTTVTGDFTEAGSVLTETTRLSTGLVLGYDLGTNFSIQTEVNYTRKGFETESIRPTSIVGVDLPSSVPAEFKFDIIEMPLLAKARFGGGALKGFVEGGAYGSYIVGSAVDVKARFLTDEVAANPAINLQDDALNRFDYGLSYGAGFEYDLGVSKIMFGVRAQSSMSSLLSDSDLGLTLDANRALAGNISYVLKF